jgi:hypothetical protein
VNELTYERILRAQERKAKLAAMSPEARARREVKNETERRRQRRYRKFKAMRERVQVI